MTIPVSHNPSPIKAPLAPHIDRKTKAILAIALLLVGASGIVLASHFGLFHWRDLSFIKNPHVILATEICSGSSAVFITAKTAHSIFLRSCYKQKLEEYEASSRTEKTIKEKEKQLEQKRDSCHHNNTSKPATIEGVEGILFTSSTIATLSEATWSNSAKDKDRLFAKAADRIPLVPSEHYTIDEATSFSRTDSAKLQAAKVLLGEETLYMMIPSGHLSGQLAAGIKKEYKNLSQQKRKEKASLIESGLSALPQIVSQMVTDGLTNDEKDQLMATAVMRAAEMLKGPHALIIETGRGVLIKISEGMRLFSDHRYYGGYELIAASDRVYRVDNSHGFSFLVGNGTFQNQATTKSIHALCQSKPPIQTLARDLLQASIVREAPQTMSKAGIKVPPTACMAIKT